MKWAISTALALTFTILFVWASTRNDRWVRTAAPTPSPGAFLLKLPAEAAVRGWTRWSVPVLLVVCAPREGARLSVRTGLPVEVERGVSRSVSIRFDEGRPIIAKWIPSDDRQTLTAPSPEAVSMIRRFATARRLDIGFVPLRSDPVIVEFVLSGFGKHWAGAASTCNPDNL
jgi:hypothetical protein